MRKSIWGAVLAGSAAGIVSGLFGAGGGLVLIPLLTLLTPVEEDSIFATSLSIMLPICVVTLTSTAFRGGLPLTASIPYLLGGALGGTAAGIWGRRIPTVWLHRILGILILWGGIRYLW